MSSGSFRKALTVLHFADLHLSEVNLEQTKPALDFIVDEVERGRPDLVVFAGDLIVKRGYITPYEDFLIKSAFLKMAEVSTVVAIPGNHDTSNRFDRVDAVTGILTRDDQTVIRAIHPGIKVSGSWGVFDLKMDGILLRIFTLPHPSKYVYLAANENEVGDHLNTVISEKLQRLLLGTTVITKDGMPTILVGHGTITGGVTESEMVMTTENDIAVDRGWLPDCSCLMYGHLHKPQTVGKAVYSGSAAPLTFGSEKLDPSHVLWEIPMDGSKATFERIPIPVAHQLLTIDIPEEAFCASDNLGDASTPMDVLKARLREMDLEGAKVQLRYRIPEELATLVDKAEIQRFLDQLGAFEHRILCESISPIRVRAEEMDQDLSIEAMLESWAGLEPLRKEMLKEIKSVAREVDNQIPEKERYKFVGNDYRITRIKAQNFKPLVDINIEYNKLGKIVCISGENHNGKSQLAELERFAFWKVLRKGTLLSDAVRHGAERCKVSVWFTANGKDYRVDRSVTLDGKGNAKSDIVFLLKDNGQYKALNEGNAAETQEAIEQVVGSYRMYRTTRFGSQKEISLLVNMLPSEMKDTLQEAISIGVFDVRKQVASTVLEELKKKWHEQNAQIVRLEKQVESKQDLEAELEVTRGNRNEIQERIRELKKQLEEVKAKWLEREKAAQEMRELDTSRLKVDSEIDDTKRKLEKKRRLVENREKVAGGVKRTQEFRKLLEVMSDKQVKYRESEVEFIKRRTELIQGDSEVRRRESQLAGELQRREFEVKRIIEKYEQRVNDFTDRIEELQNRSRLVNEVPCVGSEMNDTCQLLQNARESRLKLNVVTEELKCLQENPSETKEHEKGLLVIKTQMEAISRELEDVKAEMLKLEDHEKAEMEKVGYDKREHDELKRSLKEMEKINYEQLEKELVVAEQQINSLEKELKWLRSEKDKLDSKYEDLRSLTEKHDDLKVKVERLEESLEERENARDVFIEKLGRLQNSIESIQKVEAELNETAQTVEELTKQIEAHEMYMSAVSRDGIPFLLLEKVLPRFERDANQFLCVDEGFSSTLRILVNPLRETKSGELKDEVVIRYIDDRGNHPLGEASGWQEVAIGYALRAAMAKLQATASGTRINHCIYDEGWGVFDEKNILMGKRMIQKLGEEFGQFFYITHMSTLKEVADTTITVKAIEGGSEIEIS